MMSANINDYALMPLKTVEAALADFDCGREDIDDFFSFFNLSYDKTNQIIDVHQSVQPEQRLLTLINDFIINICPW